MEAGGTQGGLASAGELDVSKGSGFCAGLSHGPEGGKVVPEPSRAGMLLCFGKKRPPQEKLCFLRFVLG